MKRIVFVVTALLMGTFVFAQGLQVGARLGVNRGTLSTAIPNINEGPVQTGFTGGAFGRVSLLGFFAQPELMYAQHVGKFETAAGNYTNKLNYFDMNLMVGYSLMGVVRLNIGPSLGMLMGANQDADNATVADPDFNKSNFESSYWGLQFGGGVDVGKICIDIRWISNMTEMGKVINVNGISKDYTTNSRQLMFSIGYKFIKI